MQDDTDRENIRPRINWLASELFGCHVADCAEDRAIEGLRTSSHIRAAGGDRVGFRQIEVENLDATRPASRRRWPASGRDGQSPSHAPPRGHK